MHAQPHYPERRNFRCHATKREPMGLLDSPRWANHAVFTVEEVAEILRLTRWAVYEAVKRGDIPAIRMGRVLRVGRRTLAVLLGENADRPHTGEAANDRR